MWFRPETGQTGNRSRTPTLAGALTALLLASLVGLTIRHSTFTPWGTDPAVYTGSAHLWARHEVVTPASLIFWAPWSRDGILEAPMGHHPGLTRGTTVPDYPLGFPVLMAAAIRIGGELAPYVVPPLFAGVLGWCAYVLGSTLAGPWAGLLAAIQVVTSPMTLLHSVVPMSDVPAGALWAVSWVMSLRGGVGSAAAAGMATAMAIMIRPNLAPLASIIGLVVLCADRSPRAVRWRHALVFAACASVGVGMILWAQAVLYGHPLRPGYAGSAEFFTFTVERITGNLRTWATLLTRVHSPAVFAGLVTVPLFLFRRHDTPETRRSAVVAWSALGLIAVNYALYLPFFSPLDDVTALRYMLPAMTALFVLNAGLAGRLVTWFASYSRLLVPVAPFLVVVVAIHSRDMVRMYYSAVPDQQRVRVMGHYLREALPRNAAVIGYLHNGAMAFYTGRMIVRLDPILEPKSLETIVDDLRRHGYHPVFVLDEGTEAPWFHYRFEVTRYGALAWPRRAAATRGQSMWYLDPADLESPPDASRAVTDILR